MAGDHDLRVYRAGPGYYFLPQCGADGLWHIHPEEWKAWYGHPRIAFRRVAAWLVKGARKANRYAAIEVIDGDGKVWRRYDGAPVVSGRRQLT